MYSPKQNTAACLHALLPVCLESGPRQRSYVTSLVYSKLVPVTHYDISISSQLAKNI